VEGVILRQGRRSRTFFKSWDDTGSAELEQGRCNCCEGDEVLHVGCRVKRIDDQAVTQQGMNAQVQSAPVLLLASGIIYLLLDRTRMEALPSFPRPRERSPGDRHVARTNGSLTPGRRQIIFQSPHPYTSDLIFKVRPRIRFSFLISLLPQQARTL
jgi:hypothetical protein